MSINLFKVLDGMNKMTRSCYEEHPDGSVSIKMPTFEDSEEFDTQADRDYEEWKANDVNRENI